MDYKDLLERYKKGLVNEEEKKIIEDELKKHEAFEEYMVENFEDELSEMKADANEKKGSEETDKLKKNVNRRLRNNIVKSVLIIIVLYVGIFYGVSAIVDNMYFNPTAKTQSVEKEGQKTDYFYDIQAYVSLTIPGTTAGYFTTEQGKGFGNYDISYSLRNTFNKDEQRYFSSLSRGKLVADVIFEGIYSNQNQFGIWDGFDINKYTTQGEEGEDESLKDLIAYRNEVTKKYLEDLNPLSYISMSILLEEDLSMEELYGRCIREYPMIDYSWVGVRTVPAGENWGENQSQHLIGFNPSFQEGNPYAEPDLPDYPYFNLGEYKIKYSTDQDTHFRSVAEGYETHFRSRLEYIKDQEEFIKIFDTNYLKTEFYEDSLAYIDENGVKTYGVLAYATAEDFLKYIDELPYASIYINEVLPTKPNIYYN